MSDLRTIRVKKGLTIENLADGMMRSATLQEIETGKRWPQKSTRKRIESIVGPVDWRKTLAGSDRDHIIYALSEFVNLKAPGARERIRFAKQALKMIEQTLKAEL